MIYSNGKIIRPDKVRISPADRGFLLGDGLFETMRADNGQVYDLWRHWERLKNSAEFLEIPLPMRFQDLEEAMSELLIINQLGDQKAGLRLTLTRGVGPRGLLPPKESRSNILITAFPLPALDTAPLRVQIVDIRRNELSPLSAIKSLNYLDNILAKKAALKAGAQEAILLNSKGHIAEASCANIFLVTADHRLLTPRVADGALPGIMRQKVIEMGKTLNLQVEEKEVTLEELNTAAELFLTNSLIQIQPIHHLGPLTNILRMQIHQ